jgi:hypothetical protein
MAAKTEDIANGWMYGEEVWWDTDGMVGQAWVL